MINRVWVDKPLFSTNELLQLFRNLPKTPTDGEMTEAYDKDVMGSSQIRKTGEGGRVGADRRKTDAEIRRTKLGPWRHKSCC